MSLCGITNARFEHQPFPIFFTFSFFPSVPRVTTWVQQATGNPSRGQVSGCDRLRTG